MSPMSPSYVYFAHPINTYGTDLERALLRSIAEKFNGDIIVNPGSPKHQAKFQAYMASGAKEMDYWMELVRTCDTCVLLAFLDGMIGAGVYKEVSERHAHACPVWEIKSDGTFYTWAPNPARRLTVDETRTRIFMLDGKTPRPYHDL